VQVQVTYDVRRPETHLVHVTQRFPPSPDADRHFRMPAWPAGSYKIRDFGRNVQDLTAKVSGRKAAVSQPTKDEWVVAGTAGKWVELTFDVYGRELTVDTTHITSDHAHLFPSTITMYDARSRHLPHKIRILAPRGWSHWTGLETKRLDGSLDVAPDYDHLLDFPIECGPRHDYHLSRFVAGGKTHRLVIWKAPAGVDWHRVEGDWKKVVTTTQKFWGAAPYEHYTFIAHVAAEHGGGLEHKNSTTLGIDPSHLLLDDKIQNNLLPLVCHEFFHAWNVKRIMPAAFQPYDLQRETYTGLLWLFEGFTSYYELPLLHRAGVITDEAWGKQAGEMIEWFEKAVGRKRISAAQASRLTWTLLYQPHEQNINRNVSYYTKGLWIGLCLDAHLRRRGVKDGLDAVMRHLWRKHGATGVGVTEDSFAEIATQATGIDSSAKIRAWVDGTAELPIDASLRYLGWHVKREWKDPKHKLGMGVMLKAGTKEIERIPEDATAWKVLQPNDELVAVEGYVWKPERAADWAAAKSKGEPIEVAVFREGRLRTFKVPLMEMPKDKITVEPKKGDAAATRRRKEWLGEGKKARSKAAPAAGARRRHRF
jgi:predicted metalloprotease with PDZ domain